jgi:hypothetical protein
MMHNTDTPTGVAITSAPGILFMILHGLLDAPVEKWASALACIFVILQIAFLLADRLKRRRVKKHREKLRNG